MAVTIEDLGYQGSTDYDRSHNAAFKLDDYAAVGTVKKVNPDGSFTANTSPQWMGGLPNLISTSSPAVSDEDLRRQTEAQYGSGRTSIGSRFDQRISDMEAKGADEGRALEGRLGARRRFSSSAQAFLKFVDDENNKAVADLEVQKEDALNNFDFQMAQLVEKKIAAKQQEKQQEFDNMLKMIQISEKQQEMESKTADQKNELAVSDIIASGISNTSDIYTMLKSRGNNVPIGKIAETMKKLRDAESTAPGVVGEWLSAKQNDPELKDITLEGYLDLKDPGRGLELTKKRLEVQKMQKELDEAGIVGGDADLMTAYARQYATTGTIPTGLPKDSFGVVSNVAKTLPRPAGTIVNSITGVKDPTLGEGVEQDFSRLYNIVNNVKRLEEALSNVSTPTGIQNYETILKAIVDDMQRMQSGAALTKEESEFYADYLPGSKSASVLLGKDVFEKIGSFSNVMNDRLNERTKNRGISIHGYSKVDVGGQQYTVGDMVEGADGSAGRVLPDGTIYVEDEAEDQGPQASVQIPQSSRLSFVNNNPGNLRFVDQEGASKGQGGFAKFRSPEAGYQALKDQIELDASRGMSLAQFVNKFAPPTENDTNLYIRQMASMLGVRPTDKLSGIDVEEIARAVARKESGANIG